MRRCWLVEAKFLFLVVRFVADTGAPGRVRVESASSAAAARLTAGSVGGFFVAAAGGVAVVSVLELADLRVDPAFDAGGRGAGVIGCAARGRGFTEGDQRVHGWWRESIARCVPSCVEVPAEVGPGEQQEQDDDEDHAAVHCGGVGVGVAVETMRVACAVLAEVVAKAMELDGVGGRALSPLRLFVGRI